MAGDPPDRAGCSFPLLLVLCSTSGSTLSFRVRVCLVGARPVRRGDGHRHPVIGDQPWLAHSLLGREIGRLGLPLRLSAGFWSRSVPGSGRVAPHALFRGCGRRYGRGLASRPASLLLRETFRRENRPATPVGVFAVGLELTEPPMPSSANTAASCTRRPRICPSTARLLTLLALVQRDPAPVVLGVLEHSSRPDRWSVFFFPPVAWGWLMVPRPLVSLLVSGLVAFPLVAGAGAQDRLSVVDRDDVARQVFLLANLVVRHVIICG